MSNYLQARRSLEENGTTAFLNGDLDEEIYMKQPEGFKEGGPEYILHLLKSLYGLKQSACQ